MTAAACIAPHSLALLHPLFSRKWGRTKRILPGENLDLLSFGEGEGGGGLQCAWADYMPLFKRAGLSRSALFDRTWSMRRGKEKETTNMEKGVGE